MRTPRLTRTKRVLLAALMVLAGVNVWVGSPLLALWIGSRAQGDGPPTMAAVFVVVVLMAVFSLILAYALSRLGAIYDGVTGKPATVRRHTPWLRSMRGENLQYPGSTPTLTALERILVIMVVTAFLLFEVWFFFFSTSPIDQRSGRSAIDSPVTDRTGMSTRSEEVERRGSGPRAG